MVEAALRSVVRDALAQAAESGLPGAHHFYITFRTDFPGVELPGFLHSQYPQEMTIVLEHQFWGLEVDEASFAVTLSFHGQNERLTIPFAAIAAFADPSVKFGLEFRAGEDDGADSPAAARDAKPTALAKPQAAESAEIKPGGKASAGKAAGPKVVGPVAEAEAAKPGEVVKLDAFRKK